MSSVYNNILNASQSGKKQIAVLIDPDQLTKEGMEEVVMKANIAEIDYFFVGGSLIFDDCLDLCLDIIKSNSKIPAVIFPGNNLQINEKADAILFLSLISGRNPEFLIGKQVLSAPALSKSNLEVIGTGYMLIDGGRPTAASYMSHSQPIPHNKDSIATSTALAGQFLGHKLIFMDAGSGADRPVSESMIKQVKKHINIPLIIGGGIQSKEKVRANFEAGADIVVVGNAIEQDINFIQEIAEQRYQVK